MREVFILETVQLKMLCKELVTIRDLRTSLRRSKAAGNDKHSETSISHWQFILRASGAFDSFQFFLLESLDLTERLFFVNGQ
jgi:hypothetical protein